MKFYNRGTAEDERMLNGMLKNKFLQFGASDKISPTSQALIRDEEIIIKCYIAILDKRQEFAPLYSEIYVPWIHRLATKISSV